MDKIDENTRIDIHALWSALTEKEQDQACLDFWTTRDGQGRRAQQWVIEALAKAIRFRKNTVADLPAKSKAEHLRKRVNTRPFLKYHDDLIRAWLLENKRRLLIDFMDGTGLPHDEGILLDPDDDIPPPDAETLESGLSKLCQQPPHDVAIYLGFLIIVGGEFWENLPDAIENNGFPIIETLNHGKSGVVEEPAGDEEDSSAEDNESFTTLDNSLIQQVVASAFGEEGALSEEQTLDLITEVVALNAKRHRSVFHLGYFHAVFGKKFEFHFPGENRERRLWYLCGVLFGLLRRGQRDRCVEILGDHTELTEVLSSATNVPCGAMVLPHLYSPLLNAGRITLLARWIESQMMELPPNKLIPLIHNAHDDAAAMIREGRIAEAELLLDNVATALRTSEDSGVELIPPRFANFLGPRTARRMAQIRQQQGNLTEARAILETLDHENLEPNIAASVLSDLGLIEGGFRSLQKIVPRKNPEAAQALRDSISKGREFFEKAVATHDRNATNAHFALGILQLLGTQGSPSDSPDHFKKALGGMLRSESAYSAGALIDWNRFCLGLSLLENLDEADFMLAAENIRAGLAAETPFPIWMWTRVLAAASAFEDKRLATDVATSLLEHRSSEAFAAIREAGVLSESPDLRKAYLTWLLEQKIPLSERWDQLQELLPQCISDGSCELGETILDELEGLADRDPEFRPKFVELLSKSSNYSPIWEPSDAELALARFHEAEGNFAEAAEIWQRRFYRLRESGEPWHLDEAREIVEALRSFKLPDLDAEQYQRLVEEDPEDTETEASVAYLRNGGSVSVLYVGGNETQAAYEDKIRHHFKERLPGLKLGFYFPGWSSSWNYHLEKVRNELPDHDAVVLSNLVRTQFGRHMRSLCDSETPWFACTGRGRKSLQRAIEKAALWAAERKDSTSG